MVSPAVTRANVAVDPFDPGGGAEEAAREGLRRLADATDGASIDANPAAGLTRAAEGKFAWGTGPLPKMTGYPQGNSIIGGATLWVMKGAKPEEYKGVAQFFKYLASTENQAWWAGVTGYLPLTQTAVKAMEASGVYTKTPALKTAVTQMNAGKTTPNSQGLRLGNYGSIRDAIEEQMENVFAGKKTAKQGLDDAVTALADIAEFADEAEHDVQAQQHQPGEHDRAEDDATDVDVVDLGERLHRSCLSRGPCADGASVHR